MNSFPSLKKSLLLLSVFSLAVPSTWALKKVTECVNKGDFALTFDDGPSLEYTNTILDILDRENVKATFFINGKNTCDLKNNPEAGKLIKREFESGHVIGSHTYSHPLTGITKLSNKRITYEINTLSDIVNDIIGVKPAFFRPPLGEYTPENEKVLEKCGITANIIWNLDSEDWNVQYNATQQYIDTLKNSNPSSNSFIALNHDIQKVTATKNLEIIIPYIRSLGYRFVTMEECTGMNAYQNGATNPYAKSSAATSTTSNVNTTNIINKNVNPTTMTTTTATTPTINAMNSKGKTSSENFNLNAKSSALKSKSITYLLSFNLLLWIILLQY